MSDWFVIELRLNTRLYARPTALLHIDKVVWQSASRCFLCCSVCTLNELPIDQWIMQQLSLIIKFTDLMTFLMLIPDLES